MHGIEFPLLLLTVSHRGLSTWTWTDSFHRHGHHVQTRINWHIGHSPHDSISFCAVHFVVRVVFLISALANCTSLRSLLRPVLVVLDRKREQRLMLPDILHLHPSPKSALGPSVHCTCKYSWTPCRRHIDGHIVVIPEGAINRHKTTDDEAWQRTWDVVTIQQLLPILRVLPFYGTAINRTKASRTPTSIPQIAPTAAGLFPKEEDGHERRKGRMTSGINISVR